MKTILPVLIVLIISAAARATSVSDYHKHLTQAINALDSLGQIADENETTPEFETRSAQTIASVQQLIPAKEAIEFSEQQITADNSWLQTGLEKYKTASASERADLRSQMIDRLHAIAERVNEIQSADIAAQDKEQNSRKLGEILQRPEYARKVKEESAITRVLQRLLKWLESFIPKPKPLAPRTSSVFSSIAQIFVIVLALVVLIFVARLFLPRLLKSRGHKRKVKEGPRIVLGEELQPDQSATDLLAEAESLARAGDLRAAIRKGYIALLVELGERKVISLEQHKTNYDYLRAVRRLERLYPSMKQLTDSFEQHWYGFARATESDWQSFRATYKQALT
ncbi:MAG TPA: DUF4129 domain-containing protein [Pyrinomonadaceae bacterium]|nr:DUF4129 domain-containing protein [Pyrinomonadaceae bacterium]